MSVAASIVAPLLLWAAQHTGYSMPAELPEVQVVSEQWMGQRACPRAPTRCPVFGLYDDKDVIYIRDDLTPQAFDHILLHELVHFLQHHSGKFNLESCLDKAMREREAYHVQNLYIWHVQNGIFGMVPPPVSCMEALR